MKDLMDSLREIRANEHRLLIWMALLFMVSVMLLAFSLVSLRPGSSVVKISYGDIGRYQGGEWSSMSNSGGYHDGSWMNMFAFPLLALVFGVIHNFLAVKLYSKRGAAMAKVLVAVSIGLVIFTFIVLARLLGEG